MDLHTRLEDLRSVAAKLSIEIAMENLGDENMPVQSGYCKVKGKNLILLDKKLSQEDQIRIILEAVEKFDLESIYVPSWIREHLEKRPTQKTEL